MKINYVKTIGFRKFEKEFETKLYDITTIIGANTKGKTNILYAIVWGFLGTNLTGDDKVWLGNKKSDDCYVELHFIDNQNISHILVRYKNKYDNKQNFLLLDNQKINQDTLVSFYSDKKLFLSILNPSYFLNKSPAEQKLLLDSYLPDVDISTVYEKMEVSEKKCLEGIPDNIFNYLKDLNSNKKMYEDKIKNIRGKIEYAENLTNEKLEEKKIFEKEEELSLAMQELSYLQTDTKAINKAKQQQIIDDLNSQILQIQAQIESLTVDMADGKKTYLSIKSQEVAHCPMCEQEIKNHSKTITVSNMKKELEELFDKKMKLENNLSDLKSKLMVEKCKLYALDKRSNVEKSQQISNIQNQITTLEQEKSEIENYNSSIILKQNNINKANQDIVAFKKQISEYKQLIQNVKDTKDIAQKLLINYIEEKMKFANKHLKNVSIKYYSVLKDSGELKEDFIIQYNNNELKSLSRSETIATSVELCNMLNMVSGINIPLFIDDSESCTDYNFTQEYSKNTQILIASAKKGHDLTIQESCLKDDYLQVA